MIDNLVWSPQQETALAMVGKWLREKRGRKPVFHLFGYAGTGKTTLAIEIADMVDDGRVIFASFTGKAALVMKRKGCHGARTIHSLIYKCEEDPVTGEVLTTINRDSDLVGASLLIIDECSMVGEEIGADLLSFGVPILVLGDPAQLPPIQGAGFFTDFSDPEIMLTEIHRQARGNPIIQLATQARNNEPITHGTYSGDFGAASVIKAGRDIDMSLIAADQIICGRNATRHNLNRKMREMLGRQGWPQKHLPVIGDKLICLKNRRDRALWNGALWEIDFISDRGPDAKKKGRSDASYLRIGSLDDDHAAPTHIKVLHPYWIGNDEAVKNLDRNDKRDFDEFDYGYAITCHKSQGSQWDKIVIYDESYIFRPRDGESDRGADIPSRWLYTAITRAAEKLILVK